MMPKNKETRMSTGVEIRAGDGGDFKVEGYAAVFGEVANIAGYFDEVIERGAFAKSLKADDVVFLINHDGLPLARTKSGTLSVVEDDHGLKISATLAGVDPDVKSIKTKMERGDLDKMSFAFYPTVQEWDESGEIPLRKVKEATIYDVSIVTTPAYEGTEIAMRSRAAIQHIGNDFAAKRMATDQAMRGIR